MKRQSKAGILLRMLGLVKPLSGWMLFAVLMGSLGFLAAQFIPILGGMALLGGLGYELPFSFRGLCFLLPGLALARALFRLSEQRSNHYIAFTLLALIRDKVFQALRRLCPAKLEGRDKGDLIHLITSDVELLEVFYAHTVSPICIAVLCSGIMTGFIAGYHWSLGLLALSAFLSVGILLPTLIARRSGNLGDELRARSGELASYMLENIRGMDETFQYGCGEARLAAMNRKTEELNRRQSELSRLNGLNLALTNSMILFFGGAMLLLAGWLYQRGMVAFDAFLIPLIALISSFGPVTAVANLGTTLTATIASASRVLAILDEKPEAEELTGKEAIRFQGAELKKLSFSYGGERVLKELSLSFPGKKITAVLGPSGCGKSTMLKLLMRFWQADEGSVMLSGRSIEEINTADLRGMEAYMTQETQLFKDSIANNVRIGKLNATDEEVEAACRKAALHDFILSLPRAYATQLEELGENLSGGERQRIGLARAFLHEAPFLLLDEPSSNLDSLNEALILRSLREASEGKSIVLVSHRPSTLRIADTLIEMEEGCLLKQTEEDGAGVRAAAAAP